MNITGEAQMHNALQRWRDEDHEETIALSREQVIAICEEFRALPHLSQGAVGVKADAPEQSDAERVSKLLGTAIDGQVVVAAMEDGGYGDSPFWLWRNHETNVTGFGRWAKENGQAPYIRADIAIKGILSALSALSPAPVGVTDELGWNSHDGMGDPDIAGNTLVEVCFLDGETAFGLMHDWDQNWSWAQLEEWRNNGNIVAWRRHSPKTAPTDTQEEVSEAGEVVWHRYYWADNPDVWLGSRDNPRTLLGHSNFVVEPLVRKSALAACQQEVETLREGIKEIAEREQSIRDNWARHEAETGARILELETDLEIANDKLQVANKALRKISSGIYDGIEVTRSYSARDLRNIARAALGGQSNG